VTLVRASSHNSTLYSPVTIAVDALSKMPVANALTTSESLPRPSHHIWYAQLADSQQPSDLRDWARTLERMERSAMTPFKNVFNDPERAQARMATAQPSRLSSELEAKRRKEGNLE
jgi:hypothetical protein